VGEGKAAGTMELSAETAGHLWRAVTPYSQLLLMPEQLLCSCSSFSLALLGAQKAEQQLRDCFADGLIGNIIVSCGFVVQSAMQTSQVDNSWLRTASLRRCGT